MRGILALSSCVSLHYTPTRSRCSVHVSIATATIDVYIAITASPLLPFFCMRITQEGDFELHRHRLVIESGVTTYACREIAEEHHVTVLEPERIAVQSRECERL